MQFHQILSCIPLSTSLCLDQGQPAPDLESHCASCFPAFPALPPGLGVFSHSEGARAETVGKQAGQWLSRTRVDYT